MNDDANATVSNPDAADRAAYASIGAERARARRQFAWLALAFAVATGLAALAASSGHGKTAKRWTSVAFGTGALAGLCGLVGLANRARATDLDPNSGGKSVWSGTVTGLRRGGYRGSVWVLQVDGRTFTLDGNRPLPVAEGEACTVHFDAATGETLRVERGMFADEANDPQPTDTGSGPA